MASVECCINQEKGRHKLSIDQQIIHMRDEKGILFNSISEDDAKKFLEENTYYFKIKSYAKNYEKYRNGPKKGKYINLDFAYLKELSTIDMHIRNIVTKMTNGIEHYLKTKFLKHFSENEYEDGYSIVQDYFGKYPRVKEEIERKCENSACSDLVIKYYDKWAIWNVVEVISFGDLINLYKLYCSKYNLEDDIINCLWSVKFIRNAAVHSNCLINSLRIPYMSSPCPRNPCEYVVERKRACSRKITRTKEVSSYLSLHLRSATTRKIDSQEMKTMMSNPVIHDFITTLYAYNMVCNQVAVKYMMEELKELFEKRIVRKKEYFIKNEKLVSSYKFVKIIIDYFFDRCV